MSMIYAIKEINYDTGIFEYYVYPYAAPVKRNPGLKPQEKIDQDNLLARCNNLRKLLNNNFLPHQGYSAVLTFSNVALKSLRAKIAIPPEINTQAEKEKYIGGKLIEVVRAEVTKFMRKLKRACAGTELRYIFVVSNRTRLSDGSLHPVRVHVHLIVSNLMLRKNGQELCIGTTPLKDIWGYGFVKSEKLKPPEFGRQDFTALAKYLIFQSTNLHILHRKSYVSAKCVCMPEEKTTYSVHRPQLQYDTSKYNVLIKETFPYTDALRRLAVRSK